MKNPYLLLIFATLFWAGNFVLSKAMSTEIPPVALAFWRWSMAFLLLVVVARKKAYSDWPVIIRNIPVLIPISFFGVAAFNTLIYVGLQDTSALNSLLLQSFFPVVVAGMSFLFLGERLRRWQLLGIILSLCGTLLLVARGNPVVLLSAQFNDGDLWIITAVFCYASYAELLRYRPPIHALSFLLITFGLGTLMLLPFYLWEHTQAAQLRWEQNTVLTVAYLAVFPSFISYLFFNEAVRRIGASTAGLFSHLVPLFGVSMAILLLGEQFYNYHAMGAALIFSGIYLVIRYKKPKPKSHTVDKRKYS